MRASASGVAIGGLALLLSFEARAAGVVVARGYPFFKVSADYTGATPERMTEKQSGEFHMRIELGDSGHPVLATRESKELVCMRSGLLFITCFHSGGFIKMLDPKGRNMLPESPRAEYMEVMHTYLGTVTYWGKLETFEAELLLAPSGE